MCAKLDCHLAHIVEIAAFLQCYSMPKFRPLHEFDSRSWTVGSWRPVMTSGPLPLRHVRTLTGIGAELQLATEVDYDHQRTAH